jgi:RNA polymerase sigma factor (sigma-70 family)
MNTPDLAVLLANHTWLHRLAAHLVSGADGADDAVQETWVAALRDRPSVPDDPRPWLRKVLHNVIRRQARTDARRRAREETATAFEAGAHEGAPMETLEIHRRLTELVAALDEPFRTTIVMRYFEDKSAAEIARQIGIPEGTVRWRTKEGLDRLRAALDQQHAGDRCAWIVLLAPLVPRRRPVIRTAPVAVAASMVVVAGVVALAVSAGPGGRRALGGPVTGDSSSLAIPRFLALAATTAGVPAPASAIDGIVFGPDGKPVAGAVVTARAAMQLTPGRMTYRTESPLPDAQALSGQDGRFHLADLPPGRYAIGAAHPAHAGAFLLDVAAPVASRIELRLGTSGTVFIGRVSDEGGGPIPGARVIMRGRSATFAALTTEAGDYRLVLPEPGFDLVASASGYAPAANISQRFDAGQRRDFRLSPAARVVGHVTAAGHPAAGVTVRLMPVNNGPPDHWERRAVTDHEGRFVIAELPPVQFRLLVRHERLVARARTLVSLRAGGQEAVELALEPGVTLRGTIRDTAGKVVPGAGLAVTEAQGMETARGALAEGYADAKGAFVIDALPPSKLELRPAAMGYASRTLTIDTAAEVGPLDLVLEPMAGLVGVVRRPDGSAAAGVQLRGNSRPQGVGGGRMSMSRSDANGRFVMEGLGSGVVTLVAWTGTEAALIEQLSLGVGERKEIEVKLAPGATVSGRVRWEDGKPAAGVTVRGNGGPVQPRPGQSIHYDLYVDAVTTDSEGRFSVGPFLPGRVDLASWPAGERQTGTSSPRPNQATAVVTAGAHVGGLEMTVSTRRQRLAGVTLGPGGLPLPGATVIAVRELAGGRPYPGSFDGRRSISGGDGTFVVDGLTEGTFTVFAQHPDHPDVEVSGMRAGASDVRVTFPAPSAISGVVVTKAGRPVKESFVVVTPPRAPSDPQPRDSQVAKIDVKDPKGAFSASRLLPGKYDVTATTSDSLVGQALGVALAVGETKRIRVVVEPSAAVTGHVVDDATGAPAANVKVWSPLPGLRSASVTADASGAFRLPGLIAGEHIRVSAGREVPPFDSGRVEVDIARLGATVDVGTIRLRPRVPEPPAPPPK